MCHELPRGSDFWSFLVSVDRDVADRRRQVGCDCGGRLHAAHYPRKPRGSPEALPDEFNHRFSFCCDRDGCRKRVTPPSVRFLGRRVYLGAIVILVAAMQQGLTPRRVRDLASMIGADRTTLLRWQVFWRERFPQTKFWKVARAQLVLHVNITFLPQAFLQAFMRMTNTAQDWGRLLTFLSPITITEGLS